MTRSELLIICESSTKKIVEPIKSNQMPKSNVERNRKIAWMSIDENENKPKLDSKNNNSSIAKRIERVRNDNDRSLVAPIIYGI